MSVVGHTYIRTYISVHAYVLMQRTQYREMTSRSSSNISSTRIPGRARAGQGRAANETHPVQRCEVQRNNPYNDANRQSIECTSDPRMPSMSAVCAVCAVCATGRLISVLG